MSTLAAFTLETAMVRGIQAVRVRVEVSSSNGLPGISIVGMPDTAVLEARSRVRCALRACNFEIPRLNITVNLAPSELKKTGTSFDLPIAVAILCATAQIPTEDIDRCLFVGELGLDGSVCPPRGSIAYALEAAAENKTLVAATGQEFLSVHAARCRTISSLSDLRAGVGCLPEYHEQTYAKLQQAPKTLDYADVYGQELAKRAFVVAATGRHGLLMVGPPGSGKTMLARRIPSILPPLSEQERVQAMLIHSVAGVSCDDVSAGIRPFRMPHHSISAAGLIGGGRPVRPGEISLAHTGVLFLDELAEFSGHVLQSLRQPMEDHVVRITRVDGAYEFPCDFLLVGAANPCPCGHLGDATSSCRCSEAAINRYQAKLTGPLVDRIDLQLSIAKPDPATVIDAKRGLDSKTMSKQVGEGRAFRHERLQAQKTSYGGLRDLAMSPKASNELMRLARNLALGGRAIVRIARVARTIADLRAAAQVDVDDVMEASLYRTAAAS